MLFNFNLLCFYAMEMGLSQCLSTYAFVETSMDFQEWEHSTKEEKQKGKLKLTNRHSYEEEKKRISITQMRRWWKFMLKLLDFVYTLHSVMEMVTECQFQPPLKHNLYVVEQWCGLLK